MHPPPIPVFMDLAWLNSQALPCLQSSSSHSKSLLTSELLISASSILCPAKVSVLSARPCCICSFWELPYLSAALPLCSIAHFKSGCLTRTTEQLGLWMYPWARAAPGKVMSSHLKAFSASNEAHAIKIKFSNMTRFSWILKRVTTKTHPHWQNNPVDKTSDLKHRSGRAFQPTIKILLQEAAQLFLLTKSQIHPRAAAKPTSVWQSSAQQKQTSTQGSTTSYTYITSYRLALPLLCTVTAKHCTVKCIAF